MSHSFTGPSGATYFHNGDFIGTVQMEASPGEEEGAVIPFEDIRAMYLTYLRGRKIGRLEQIDYDELERDLISPPSQMPSLLEFDSYSEAMDWIVESHEHSEYKLSEEFSRITTKPKRFIIHNVPGCNWHMVAPWSEAEQDAALWAMRNHVLNKCQIKEEHGARQSDGQDAEAGDTGGDSPSLGHQNPGRQGG